MERGRKRILTQAIDTLDKIEEVSFAYLFGSYARGGEMPYSDLDIAIYVRQGFDPFDIGLQTHHRLETSLHKEIDLVLLNRVRSISLLEEIFDEGIVLKDSDERAVYEVRKWHEILDYKGFQRMIDAA